MSDLQLFQATLGLAGYREQPFTIDRNVVAISRSAHPTSANAALRALPKSGSKRKRVYDFIQRVDGATDEEIEEELSISGNTVRPTRGSLVKDGFIVDSGIVRLTKAGNPAIVWRVA